MVEELIQLQNRFQPFLRGRDYTFIGPEDQCLLEKFMRRANDLAPIVSVNREICHFLNNKEVTIQALEVVPITTQLRIYVVDGRRHDILLHNTIEEYCTNNNIKFDI